MDPSIRGVKEHQFSVLSPTPGVLLDYEMKLSDEALQAPMGVFFPSVFCLPDDRTPLMWGQEPLGPDREDIFDEGHWSSEGAWHLRCEGAWQCPARGRGRVVCPGMEVGLMAVSWKSSWRPPRGSGVCHRESCWGWTRQCISASTVPVSSQHTHTSSSTFLPYEIPMFFRDFLWGWTLHSIMKHS